MTLEASFEDLNADSLDVVELCRGEFDIEIPDEDAEKININSYVEYIRQSTISKVKNPVNVAGLSLNR